MDSETDRVPDAPSEDLDFSVTDWLEDLSRAEFGGEPYDETKDRTVRDLVELWQINQKTAREWLDKQCKAGILRRRDVILNGKRTAVYRQA